MDPAAEYARQVDLIGWINTNHIGEFSLQGKDHLALAAFDLTIEHHAAICRLYDSGLFGSMFALLRVAFESYCRGLWIRHVATDEQLQKFCSVEERAPRFEDLVPAIETHLNMTSGPLSQVKSNAYKTFCSFTHTGHQALRRRISDTETGAVNYERSDLRIALNVAGAFAVLAAAELATLSGNDALVELTKARVKAYARNE